MMLVITLTDIHKGCKNSKAYAKNALTYDWLISPTTVYHLHYQISLYIQLSKENYTLGRIIL